MRCSEWDSDPEPVPEPVVACGGGESSEAVACGAAADGGPVDSAIGSLTSSRRPSGAPRWRGHCVSRVSLGCVCL